ncbi:Ig-like domain-containing protein [Aurantibacter crassamenti]|uniref:Ig-like domain-containing protein n=1 Tax=Aurantibacter crassamenti TaxID=1837375 RepID=UPI001939FA97|nr:Ig-like domain-containing protein [Aurantibacter crassamenti]MBM1107999.1 Ig-like domain-containing protein [Aurantibacter crassamenti]
MKKNYNFRSVALLLLSVILMSAVPFIFGPGLTKAEPIGKYLNGNFPGALPQGLPYQPVFPNITFDSPLTFNEVPNDNKIIVGQRDGKIFWFDKNPSVSTKNSMIDLSEKVGVVWDGGFLGLALHPQFGTNGKNYFYVWYSTEDANSNDFPNSYTTQSCNSEEYWGNFLVLARYEANPNTLTVQPSSEQIMLKLRMYGTTHRGGGLLFGDDGFLYLTTGDQTAFKKSQDIVNNLDGGVLRLDVDKDNTKSHPPVRTMPDDHGYSDELTGNGYWIPNDNPFLSPSGQNFEEYYSMGHRNPHRMTKDRATGELYVGEIGGNRHEEINIIKKGKNFGWPLYEGLYRSTFCVQNLYNNMSHEQPLVAFPRSEANAIIGGYVYRGSEIPELVGKYICADYGSGEEIFTVDINTGAYEQYGNFTSTNIISFGEDKEGELYIMKQGVSSLYKVSSKNTGFGNTPQLLSETGAFSNLTNLTPTDGLIPYDLVESFWSDGAVKKRWMAIPNDGSHNTIEEKIKYTDVDEWDFPIGSVLVKHFELPIDKRNPSVTKRLETRFSIKANDGNFYFVTYKWNDQQTDATLLTSGLEENINVVNENGSAETQTWSYPSTIDCVSCHNPATGGVIGAKSRYLNKDYTYPKTGSTGNQLVTLSHLGILDQAISDGDTNSILTSKSIDDPTASIDDKARSYLDLNCAYCHRPGTGNRGDFDLRLNLDLVQTGVLTASPYIPLGIPDEKIVDPGNVATSILYHRVNSTDPSIKMPPISKNKIDVKAVALINDWINQLNPDLCKDRIIFERFNNVPGTSIAELKGNANYPDTPSSVTELNEFRIPINVDDDYGVRVKGLLKAPETGTYYFWITGDDNVELNLSTDATEANKTRIAYHNNWSLDSEWDKYATQKSAGINLVAGQNYYIEGLMNERGGGDNLSVGWRKPSNGNGDTPFQVIPCTAFDVFNTSPVVKVTDVTLDIDSATLAINETQQLTATVNPTDAEDTTIIWSSLNPNIATVDTNGLVTAIAKGTTKIIVTTNDGGFTAEANITVTLPVTGITVNPTTTSIQVDETTIIEAIVAPANASNTNVTWTTSDSNIATVNTNGLVRGITTGDVTITATTTDGNFSASAQVTITAKPIAVTGITVDPTTTSIQVDETTLIEAIVAPANASNTNVTWTTSDPNIATVNTNGLVRGITAGDVTITATTTDGSFSASAQITITAKPIAVTGITLDPTTTSIQVDETTIIEAIVAPANASNTNVTWTTSDSNIATVNTNGLVLGITAGDVSITATTTDGSYSANAQITITAKPIAVTGITLDPTTISIQVDETVIIEAIVAPANASDATVTWTSSDTNIATVNTSGLVSGITSGDVSITTTTTDGNFSASAQITITAKPIAVTGITLDPTTTSIQVDETTIIEAIVAPENASDASVTWTSSDTNIATVNASGVVRGINAGDATITATTTDGNFSASTNFTITNSIVCSAQGVILMDRFDGIVGEPLSQLLNASNYPNNPSQSQLLSSFDIPRNAAENYGARVHGYLCAPETGTYYFWIAGDDHVQLNLSSDSKEANKIRIAYHNEYTSYKEWNVFSSQKSVGVQLLAGESYFIEGLMKEGDGGDHLTVGWRKPSDGNGNSPSQVIPGTYLSPASFEATAVTGVTISQSTQTISAFSSVKLDEQVSPANATDTSVNWSSSNPAIATVTSNGYVQGVAQGNATITVTTNDGGYTATTEITVENKTECSADGMILMHRYDDIYGEDLNILKNSSNYPDNPSVAIELTEFDIPKNNVDNYGARVHGYLCAPESGTYYFWVAGDDHVELNLSSNSEEKNKIRIAYHNEYTEYKEWNIFNSQKSIGIQLYAGQKYFIEALVKEGDGGDHLTVGWRKPSDGNGNEPSEIIPGTYLSLPDGYNEALNATQSNKQAVALKVSINPVVDILNVHVTNVEDRTISYHLFSQSGVQVVYKIGGSEEDLDTSSLPSGIYTLVAHIEDKYLSKQIIVK